MKSSKDNAVRKLTRLFHRGGYVKRQNPLRCRSDGYQLYKKGDEIRLTAESESEIALIQQLLSETGFRFGKPFAHRNKFRQPIYGKELVRKFLLMIGERESGKPSRRTATRKRVPCATQSNYAINPLDVFRAAYGLSARKHEHRRKH